MDVSLSWEFSTRKLSKKDLSSTREDTDGISSTCAFTGSHPSTDSRSPSKPACKATVAYYHITDSTVNCTIVL
jgi:hypothetical protein